MAILNLMQDAREAQQRLEQANQQLAVEVDHRKQVEGKIREALEFNALLLDSLPLGLASFAADGQCLFVNGRGAAILETSAQAFLALNLLRDPVWAKAGLRDHFQKVLEGGDMEKSEFALDLTSGKQVWVGLTFNQFQRGGEACVMATFQDVTRNRADRSRLNLQETALEAAANAVVITDPAGRIQWVNQAFVRMTGFSREEALGERPRILKSGMHGPEFYAELWSTITAGKVWSGLITNRRKDGTQFDEDMVITPVKGEHGKIEHYVAIKQDLSDRKDLELQLHRAQRMESIGMLASGIAHDLNNVLAPILMCVEVLRDEPMSTDATAMLSTLDTSARRGADIVRQVLGFARGMDGKKLELQPRHLIKEMVRILRETFPKNIEVSLRLAPDLWGVKGDATQLQQVLLNLCVNARDAMPEGGLLILQAENCMLDAIEAESLAADAKAGDYVRIRVEDSGLGMTQETRQKIFTPFFTTKERGKGTGLGLPNVVGIVKGHQGFIEVRSQPQQGSVFAVYLPGVRGMQESLVGEKVPEAPRGAGECILLVDDEAGIRRVTQKVLEAHGYAVLPACDGAEGIAVLATNEDKVRLIITDLLMPLSDGVTLVLAARRMAPEMPIIIATGVSRGPDSQRRMSLLNDVSVQGSLAKPFGKTELLQAVHHALHPDSGPQAG